MYLMYFKGAFAKKHGNSGVLARFVLFLFSIRHETKYGLWNSRVTLSFRSLQVSASNSKGKGAVKKHKKKKVTFTI